MKEKKRDPNAQTTDEDGNMIRKLKAVLFSPLVVTAMLFGVNRGSHSGPSKIRWAEAHKFAAGRRTEDVRACFFAGSRGKEGL